MTCIFGYPGPHRVHSAHTVNIISVGDEDGRPLYPRAFTDVLQADEVMTETEQFVRVYNAVYPGSQPGVIFRFVNISRAPINTRVVIQARQFFDFVSFFFFCPRPLISSI